MGLRAFCGRRAAILYQLSYGTGMGLHISLQRFYGFPVLLSSRLSCLLQGKARTSEALSITPYIILFIVRRPSAALLATVTPYVRRPPYALLTAAAQQASALFYIYNTPECKNILAVNGLAFHCSLPVTALHNRQTGIPQHVRYHALSGKRRAVLLQNIHNVC